MTHTTLVNDQTNDDSTTTSSKRGRLVYGIYASDVTLPWEDPAEFEKLHVDLCVEFGPHGCMEKETVFELARLSQQKRRSIRLMQKAFDVLPPGNAPVTSTGDPGAAAMVQDLRQTLTRSAEELRSRVEKVVLEPNTFEADARSFLEDALKKLEREVSTLKLIARNTAPPPDPNAPRPESKEMLEQSSIADLFSKIFKLDASIDTRIDKCLARLAYLKEYKHIEESRRIETTKRIEATKVAS